MNKKAQVGPVTFIFSVFVFAVLWFGGAGGAVNTLFQTWIDTYDITGLLAFFMSNMNLWVIIGLLLSMLAFTAWIGSQG